MRIRSGVRAEFLDVAQAQFAGEDDALDAEVAGEGGALGRGDRHLRGGVDRQLGHDLAGKAHEADILDDERIDAHAIEQAQVVRGVIQLGGEDEGVERDERAHAVAVAEGDDLGQLGLAEVIRAQPRVETRQSEVDRVRAVRDGGAHTVPVPRGGEEFGWFGEDERVGVHAGGECACDSRRRNR